MPFNLRHRGSLEEPDVEPDDLCLSGHMEPMPTARICAGSARCRRSRSAWTSPRSPSEPRRP